MPGLAGADSTAGAALKLCKELLPLPSVLKVKVVKPLPVDNALISLATGPLATKIISLPFPISTLTLMVPAAVGAFF